MHTFDPADSRRTVRIALSELGEIGWLPAILSALRARAPHVRVEVVALDVDALPEWLARGIVDLAVTTATIPGRFERRILKSQRYAVVMSESNPLADAPMDLDAYAGAEHVVAREDSGAPLLSMAQRRAGLAIEPTVSLRHVTTLPPVIAASRALIATVPDTIGEGWAATWPLAVRPLPFDMAPVDVALYRRATTQHMAALDWLYATVAHAIEGSSGRFFVIHGDSIPETRVAAGR
ncbi:hypothetical protein GCM10009808_24640 [Microbacterium sediminicola]|uniref:LysR substrate-binding domain-containing protein n=1 Tax=Microbacterium sediminicola TaxID=415210 RepID=A0ABN2III5_9MICO